MSLEQYEDITAMTEKRGKHVLITILYGISGFFVFNIANVWAQQPRGDYFGSHMMWNGGWWSGMFFGPILMVAFIGIVIAIVVYLVRRLGGSIANTELSIPSIRDPLDILRERFARGEIDKDEYEERRCILQD